MFLIVSSNDSVKILRSGLAAPVLKPQDKYTYFIACLKQIMKCIGLYVFVHGFWSDLRISQILRTAFWMFCLCEVIF